MVNNDKMASKKVSKKKGVQQDDLKGLKKKTDNSTSYNQKNLYHKQPTPGYPYGQPHLKRGPVKKGSANKLK
jgi:hypothetical protein